MISNQERQERTEAAQRLVQFFAMGVRKDGGDLRITELDVDAGRLYVEFSGACAACALTRQTIDEKFMTGARQHLKWATDIRATLDDTLGFEASRAMGREGFSARALGGPAL